MRTLSLALRNLARNRRRSLATLLAVVVGLNAVLLFGGYRNNVTYGLQTDYVRYNGHLQIQHKDYFLYGTGNPAAYGIADYQHIIDVVERDPVLAPMLTVVTPKLQLGGIAGNFAAGVSRTVFGVGVVAADQARLRRWNDYGFPGGPPSIPLLGTPADAAVIGTGVARVLQLCAPLHVANCPQTTTVKTAEGPAAPADIAALSAQALSADDVSSDDTPGDRATATAPRGAAQIELLAASAGGAPNVAELHVVEAKNQGVKELDDMFVGLHLAQAQRLVYGNAEPQATAIVLQLQHTDQIAAAMARIEHLLATTLEGEPLEVLDFRTLDPFYDQVLTMFGAIFGFIFVLIDVIVLFTIGNTMSMAVVERTAEIGTLRAMGLRRAGVRRLFVTEGALLGLFGAVLGVVIAVLVAAGINHSGLMWSPPGRVEPVPLIIRVWGEWHMIAVSAAVLVAVAVVSAWIPARRAAALDVVDALRQV